MSSLQPVEQICAKFAESLARGTLARLVVSSPITPGPGPDKVLGRFVMLKGQPHLSLTYRFATRDETKNLPVSEAPGWLREQLNGHFRSALLGTTVRDWQYISNAAGVARLIDHQPAARQPPAPDHDQKHAGLLDHSAHDWLESLGILDRDGKVRASMADKYRQINHYLEILSHLVKECGWSPGGQGSPAVRALTFADMGCGKGYLTFGLWHWLARVQGWRARVIGVESRPDLVATTNRLAQRLKAPGLEFGAGEIATAKLPELDGLIALHACNTATDDAIRRGVELKAKLIVVAPCCHREVRPQLGKPEPLAGVLRHGIMEERLAEWATDGLRASYLEWAGYRAKIMEFVGGEHTPKNLMIAAIRERPAFTEEARRQQILGLKAFFGIQHHALDGLLQAATTS